MEQVKERAKDLRIIAGVAVITCAICGAINYTSYLNSVGVFSQSATGGSYFNFTFINIVNVFLVPYVSYILEIVLGLLLLTKKLKGILVVAIINFALAYFDIMQSVLNYFYYNTNNPGSFVVDITILIMSVGGLFYLALIAFLRQKTNNKAAFVLSIIFFVITVYGYFTSWLTAISGYPGSNMFLATFSLAANILLAVYLAFGVREKPAKKAVPYQVRTAQQVGEGTQQTQQFSVGAQPQAQAFTAEDYGYQDIVKFAVLCFVTFGIWYYIWVYKTVKNLELGGKSKDAGLELVLVMFIPFYYIYWLYKASKALDEQLKAYGNTADDVVVITLILSIFVGSTIGGIFLQHKINELAKLKQAATSSANSFNNTNGGGTKNF